MRNMLAGTAFGLAAATILHQPAVAQAAQNQQDPKIHLEINTLTPSATGCLATFMVRNGYEGEFAKIAYEIVLFDGAGLVKQLMVLDFSPLPTGKTRVRQFDLPDASCQDISRVLINDVAGCESKNMPENICLEGLQTRARMDVEFGS